MWYEAKGIRAANGDIFITFGEKLRPTNVLIPHPLEGEHAGCGPQTASEMPIFILRKAPEAPGLLAPCAHTQGNCHSLYQVSVVTCCVDDP